MKIGLTYDLKASVAPLLGATDDEAEEYDPPETIDALASAIEGLGHRVVRIGGGPEFLSSILHTQVDLVFNIAEGRGTYRSRESQVPGVLEMLGIPYSGSDPLTLAICLDKPFAKQVALAAGILTPRYRVIESPTDLKGPGDGLPPFPLVVKPSFEGSSKGIRQTSKAERWEGLTALVESIRNHYRQPALVEEFIPGREVTVGVVGSPPQVLGVMEVAPQTGADDNFMYTLEVKRAWRETVFYRCPPQLPAQCVREIEAAALTLFKALGCRDIARFDFRIDSAHRVYFLEANPLPGLGSYSDVPLMAGLMGWSYNTLIENILNSALARHSLLEAQHAHRTGV